MEYQSGTPYPAYMPQGMVNDGRRWEPPQYPSQYPAPPQRTSRARIVAFAVGLVLAVAAGILLWRFVLSPNFATSDMSCWTSRDFTLGGQEYKFLESRVSDLQQYGWEIVKGHENTHIYDTVTYQPYNSVVYQDEKLLVVGEAFAELGIRHAALMSSPDDYMLVRIYNPYSDAVSCNHCVICGITIMARGKEEGLYEGLLNIANGDPFKLDRDAAIDAYGEPNASGLLWNHFFYASDDCPAYLTPINNVVSDESSYKLPNPSRTCSRLNYAYYENGKRLMTWHEFDSIIGQNIDYVDIQFGEEYARNQCAPLSREDIPTEDDVAERPSDTMTQNTNSAASQDNAPEQHTEAEERKAKAVEAITMLPSRWEEGAFFLDGNTYTMGQSTIGDVIQNGWMIEDSDARRLNQDNQGMIDPPGTDIWGTANDISLTLIRPESKEAIHLYGTNLDSAARHYTECVVTGVSVSASENTWNYDAPNLVLPGGGYIGMPQNEFAAIYGEYESYTRDRIKGVVVADYPNRFPDEAASFAWSDRGDPQMTITFDRDNLVSGIEYR